MRRGSRIKCSSDHFEQQVMIERFGEQLDRALSHRLDPDPGISVSSDEDDRNIAFLIFQPGLQLQTRHLRHKDVSYQARGLTVQTGFEEFFRGSKALRPVQSLPLGRAVNLAWPHRHQ